MDDTPYINDGADASLRKTVSLLNKIEANTAGGGAGGTGLTDAELRATPVPVSGTVTANTGLAQPLTDAQLRAAAVPVSVATAPVTPVTDNGGSLTVDGTVTANVAGTINGAIEVYDSTDNVSHKVAVQIYDELGDAIGSDGKLPISGTVELGATSLSALENISVTFPSTQNVSVSNFPATQPVSGTVTATIASNGSTGSAVPATANFVGGTDGTNLRGLSVDSSGRPKVRMVDSAGDDLPIVESGIAGTPSNDVLSIQGVAGAIAVPVSVASLPLPNGAATDSGISQTVLNSVGANYESSATSDTGTFSLISLFKRLLQKVPTLSITSSRLLVDGSGVTQPVSNTSLSNIDSDLGATADSPATTDTGTFSLISLFKRLLGTKLPDASSGRVPVTLAPAFGSFTNSGGVSSAIDCAGYNYLVQHITGGGGGYNRPIQWSNDNTNWFSGGVVFRHSTVGGSSTIGSNAHWEALGDILGTGSGIFVIPVVGRYWRIGSGSSGGGFWTHYWYLHRGPFPGIAEEGIGGRSSIAASSDTDSVGLNGLFKRLLQRITTLIPANLTVTSTRLLVDGSGVTQPVTFRGATGESTVSSFTSTTSATLKSSNASRKVLTIYNEGAGNLHVLYGSGTASTTNYSVKLFTGDYLEIDKYTGQVNAIFAATGTARVTEIV